MATTEDRLHEVEKLEELFRHSPEAEPPRQAASIGGWCRRLLYGWLAVFGSIVLFEPAPSNPDAAVPMWGSVLLTAFTFALGAGLVGLFRQRPWALRASLAAGALGIAVGAACAVTDHHSAFWAGYEVVGFSGLAAASWVASKRTA
jgi:hypothetical protein